MGAVKNPLVRDIMTKPVRTVEADWSIEELKAFLLEHDISGAPVIDRGKLVGVVSSTDLLRSDATDRARAHDGYFSTSLDRPLAADELRTMHVEGSSGQTVRDVMTPVVFQVSDDVRRAIALRVVHAKTVRLNPGGERYSGPQGITEVSRTEPPFVASVIAQYRRDTGGRLGALRK